MWASLFLLRSMGSLALSLILHAVREAVGTGEFDWLPDWLLSILAEVFQWMGKKLEEFRKNRDNLG